MENQLQHYGQRQRDWEKEAKDKVYALRLLQGDTILRPYRAGRRTVPYRRLQATERGHEERAYAYIQERLCCGVCEGFR